MTHQIQALFRVANIPTRVKYVRSTLPCTVTEGDDVVMRSPLGLEYSLNDHLLWLWRGLMRERKQLKSLVAEGAVLTCECTVPHGPIHIKPSGAEMLPLLGAQLVIQAH
jgi:hypothetical protein